ncbi:MAG: carbon starvation CstA family protein, partial [bacterium]
ALGWAVYRKGFSLPIAATLAVLIMFLTIVLGHFVPIDISGYLPAGNTGFLSPFFVWIVLLLGYCFFASILPVQVLLQPRDYINSNVLYIGLVLIILGFFVAPQPMVAPAITHGFEGAPPLFPMLFIVIACGAISGFHCLVASGTTGKQLDKSSDACSIAYGGMLLEGVLAVIVVVACCSGLSAEQWATRYTSWAGAQAGALASFIFGSASYISALGIPEAFAQTFVAVIIVSFCATTLDTATRIERYVITELADSFNIRQLAKPVPATILVCLLALSLSMFRDPAKQVIGSGGYILWPLFGTINQMLGCLALLIVTVYLAKRRKPIVFTALPMLFLLVMTAWAIFRQTKGFISPPLGVQPNYLLFGVSVSIIVLEAWMLVEGIFAFTGAISARSSQSEEMAKA